MLNIQTDNHFTLRNINIFIASTGAGGLQADAAEASQLFQELAKQGHPQAQVNHHVFETVKLKFKLFHILVFLTVPQFIRAKSYWREELLEGRVIGGKCFHKIAWIVVLLRYPPRGLC